jgi:phospholipase/carboxylesterase
VSAPPTGCVFDYVLHTPVASGDGTTVAVLLHGRGSNKRDLQGLQPLLPESWAVVTPEAPFPGSTWGYGPGSAWYRYVEEDRVVPETLEESLAKLDQFLEELPGLLGFQPGRLVLGGFSQGGTVSLAYGLSRPGSVSAVLNFSGFLVASAELDETGGSPPLTPIFWGHGLGDPAIPITLAEVGRARLKRAGANLVAKDYSIGHWIAAEEIEEAVLSLRSPPAAEAAS